MELKICQPGVDEWNLPGWCVNQDIGLGFWLQGVFEIVMLIAGFLILRNLFERMKLAWRRWKRRREGLSKWKNPF